MVVNISNLLLIYVEHLLLVCKKWDPFGTLTTFRWLCPSFCKFWNFTFRGTFPFGAPCLSRHFTGALWPGLCGTLSFEALCPTLALLTFWVLWHLEQFDLQCTFTLGGLCPSGPFALLATLPLGLLCPSGNFSLWTTLPFRTFCTLEHFVFRIIFLFRAICFSRYFSLLGHFGIFSFWVF